MPGGLIFSLIPMAPSLTTALATTEIQPFGKMPDGREISLYSLCNRRGFRAEIADYGATVVRLLAPDRQDRLADVVLGFSSVDDYLTKNPPYFGAVVGRYGNRIAQGRFTLDGKTYGLAMNNAAGGIPCHLHGGKRGFDKVVWDGEPVTQNEIQGARFRYVSRDGEEGFPGNLAVSATYWVTDDDELRIDYEATTDRPTPVNLTNHSYFNLRGEGTGSILQHALAIVADRFTVVNKGLIPTGELRSVDGTPFDFKEPRVIGERIGDDDEQLRFGGGYDHNWVLSSSAKLALAASVYEPESGRVLQVLTTEPGLQFYTGNFLDGTLKGKRGVAYERRHGFCLETQHFPDSPNRPEFPTAILRPGETLRSTTVYRFSAR